MANIDTLLKDIDALFEEGVDLDDDLCLEFGNRVASLVKDRFKRYSSKPRRTNVRISNVGQPDRMHWYNANRDYTPIPFSAQNKRRFLFGDLIEELLILLTKAAGHTVTHEQEKIELEGLTGYIDCAIDGELVDIKSASPYGMAKFKDPEGLVFGTDSIARSYYYQLSGYAEATGSTKPVHYLAMDKSSGELVLHSLPNDVLAETGERISKVKVMIQESEPPERCYEPEEPDKSGNVLLPKGCKFCDHKHECWKDANDGQGLRTFRYSYGDKHLIEVNKKPRVEEVSNET